MKLLAFVDLHGEIKAIKKIVKNSHKAELLVCAGDISMFQQGLDRILSLLNKSKKPVLIIPGNHEDPKNLRQVCSEFENLICIHNKSFVYGNYLFLGYGTGGFSVRDEDFNRATRNFSRIIRKNHDKKIILVTHAPPFGTKLDLINGEYRGNKDIRDFIKRNRINLVICGHLHENFKVMDKMGSTIIVNPGFMKMIEI